MHDLHYLNRPVVFVLQFHGVLLQGLSSSPAANHEWLPVSSELALHGPGLSAASVPFSCRHDSKRSCSFNPHDLLHRVCSKLSVPGLHSVLCAEGVLHHLRGHVRAELHSSDRQLQTTRLLE